MRSPTAPRLLYKLSLSASGERACIGSGSGGRSVVARPEFVLSACERPLGIVAGDAGRSMEQGQCVVGILMDAHARLDPVMAQRTVGQLQLELAPGHGVVALDHAFFLDAQRLDQGRPIGRRHEGALSHCRRPGEALVVARQVDLAQPAVGGLDVADAKGRKALR